MKYLALLSVVILVTLLPCHANDDGKTADNENTIPRYTQSSDIDNFITLSHFLFAGVVFFGKSYRVVRALDPGGQRQFNLIGKLERLNELVKLWEKMNSEMVEPLF